jgi:glyoxylase-like metal-dependent hydrolase (beta-lactamase superfamily II)
MRAITKRAFYLPHSTKTDRPALGYIRGDRAALMVDAGNSPAHVRLFLDELHAQGLPVPRFVALTHRHWDHTFGLCALDAVALAGRETVEHLRQAADISWNAHTLAVYLDREEIREFSEEHIRLEYPDLSTICIRVPEIGFSGETEVELGNCHCLLKQIPSPHSEDSVAVFVPEERVLFLGDAACEACAHGTWTDQPALLEQLLHAIEPLDFTVCVTGHSLPATRAELFAGFRERLAAAD